MARASRTVLPVAALLIAILLALVPSSGASRCRPPCVPRSLRRINCLCRRALHANRGRKLCGLLALPGRPVWPVQQLLQLRNLLQLRACVLASCALSMPQLDGLTTGGRSLSLSRFMQRARRTSVRRPRPAPMCAPRAPGIRSPHPAARLANVRPPPRAEPSTCFRAHAHTFVGLRPYIPHDAFGTQRARTARPATTAPTASASVGASFFH